MNVMPASLRRAMSRRIAKKRARVPTQSRKHFDFPGRSLWTGGEFVMVEKPPEAPQL